MVHCLKTITVHCTVHCTPRHGIVYHKCTFFAEVRWVFNVTCINHHKPVTSLSKADGNGELDLRTGFRLVVLSPVVDLKLVG